MESMKDPTFAAMFADYMKEISDPKARRENDLYLQQLEQQQSLPEGMKLLKPSPLFCIKATHPDHGKLFVNVCTSDLIDRPSSVKDHGGVIWNLPYSCSTSRSIMLPNNNTKPACVVDVTFHSSISNMMTDTQIQQLIQSSAVEGAEKIVCRNYSRPYRVLLNVKCKDGPPAIMRIGGSDKPNWKIPSSVSDGSVQGTQVNVDGDSSQTASDDPVHQAHDQNEQLFQSEKPIPKYEIIHRGHFQLQDCTMETPFVTSTRPKTIVVKIYLPEVDSLSNWTGVELDAHEDRLRFEITGLYSPLDIKLPYEVDHDSGRAKFSSTDRILTVTFTVIQKPTILKISGHLTK